MRRRFRPLAGYSATTKMPNTSEKSSVYLEYFCQLQRQYNTALKKMEVFSPKNSCFWGANLLFTCHERLSQIICSHKTSLHRASSVHKHIL